MINQNSNSYDLTQKRESQLWFLAVLVIVMLATALYFVDSVNTSSAWWISPQIEFALNTKIVRVSLILAVLLICAYFRESARKLRLENGQLIADLEQRGLQLEKKNLELSHLNELSDKLIEITDLKTALDMILKTAAEMLHADTASIMLKDRNTDILRIAASRGLSAAVVECSSVRVGESLAGLVARHGKPMVIQSDDIDPKAARFAQRGATIESSALVPIHLSGEVGGVINVAKRRGTARLNDDDIGVMVTLANQVTLAIEKMMLLDDLKNQVEMLGITLHELEQAQAELVQSEKLASIGKLAGGVAHEINNPLQVIMGRTELLLEDETDERKTHDLMEISEHTVRITEIVANLLNFSRQTKPADFRNVDMNDVLLTSLQLLEHQMTIDDIEVKKSLGDLPDAYGDPRQLQQVFTNLIQNAYQAMREKGKGKLLLKTSSANNEIIVEVSDTGPGIPDDAIEHIFEPFFTTKPEGEGTGLGLSVSYGIIQAHDGGISVESKVGRGTSFSVRIPTAASHCRMLSELKAA